MNGFPVNEGFMWLDSICTSARPLNDWNALVFLQFYEILTFARMRPHLAGGDLTKIRLNSGCS